MEANASLFPGPETESIFTVSSLNRQARSLLEDVFPAVAVEGEISNLATPASGHWYFTLKDKHSQLRCAMFRNRNQLLRFKPRNGLQVVVRGKLSIYEGRGDYQLIAESMEETGDGALRRAFEELKAKLLAEGLFDDEHKREIGTDYRHIGIITSATGAVIRDMVTVFRRRFPAIKLTLIPVAVQGSDAPAEIVNAIGRANALAQQLQLEALIVGRGGGSLEDLQAFNEEAVARAVFNSKLPITAAVGHETDVTITDFVADLRAPTPSAAAELMSPDQQDYVEYLDASKQQLGYLISARIEEARKNLHWMQRQLQRPDRRLQQHAQNLDRLEQQLSRAIRHRLQQTQNEVTIQRRALFANNPAVMVKMLSGRVHSANNRLRLGMGTKLDKRKQQLAEYSRGLNAVSPLQVLARGYSITYDGDGKVIRNSGQVKSGDTIKSTLADGSIRSTVIETGSE